MALGGSYARTGATILLSLVPLTVLVVFWYCAMYFGSSYLQQFMPWPGETAMVFFELLLSGELIQHAISSIGRVLFGLTLASIVGIPLGILIGRFWTARSISRPRCWWGLTR